MGKIIHESASLALKFKDKVFLAKRSYEGRYFAGYWAFPGGKVSSADGRADDRFLKAIKREIQEELKIEIDEKKLILLDKVTTPESASYRFENNFYLLELEEKCTPILNREHIEGIWIEKKNLDSFLKQKDTLIIPPIKFLLKKIFHLNLEENYQEQYLGEGENKIFKAKYFPDVTFYMVPSVALPPARHTNVLLIGEDSKLLIDPSPDNEDLAQILIKEFKRKKIEGIFISHWHPDHHQFLPLIAGSLDLPVFLSQKTFEKIKESSGENYFDSLNVSFIDEGDLFSLGSYDVIVKKHEGHAVGQLGLEPLDKSWLFVSDIFQGIGSVVVDDMNVYMQVLEDLMKKDPNTIFIPSHGFPIKGVSFFNVLYQHRLDREASIKKLFEEGKSEEEMLAILYTGIGERMEKYALKNIQGHLLRIKNSIS